jgi:single-stranded-DNA-specific exonuclease
LRRHLDLVAIGTEADVVPLRDENRVLVTHGLRALERTERPGLRALKETALVESASVRAVSHRLAPRLNAGGRLADARSAIELLTTDSLDRARSLAAELELHNAERRALEESMAAEALEAVDADGGAAAEPAIVVARDGWHPGIVGIVAARLAERHHRPALVIALDGDLGRGSGRSVPGMDLHAALSSCAELVETFGGHAGAVGLTVRRERVPVLARRLCVAVRRLAPAEVLDRALDLDAEVALSAVTPALASALAVLEPHGAGNPEPVLLARRVEVHGVGLLGDPARPHLKLRLRQDGRTLPAMGFGLGHLPVHVGDRLEVAFTPRLSRWQGVERLRLEILDVRRSPAQDVEQITENPQEAPVP